MKNKILQFLLATSLLITVTNCHRYKDKVKEIAKDRGYTKEQTEVIYHGVLVDQLMKKNEDGTRSIDYNWIPNKNILDQIEITKDDLEKLLDNKDLIEMAEDFPGMKENIEKEAKVIQFIQDTLRGHHLYAKFKGMEKSSVYDEEKDKFDLSLIDPRKNLETLLFKSKYVEEARKTGRLIEIENFKLEYNHKVKNQDPEHPTDANKFIFKNKRRALEVIGFDTNEDNIVDYIELFRLKKDGNRESLPALKIFTTLNNDNVNLAVIDQDTEDQSLGYGIPDIVETIYGISKENTSLEIFENKDLIAKIYNETEKKKVKHKEKKNYAFIVEAGQVDIPEYEISNDLEGWIVPMMYKNPMQNNYKLKILFSKPDSNNKKNTGKKQIEYIIKEWHNPDSEHQQVRGKVVEFYKMKPEFSKRNLLTASVINKKLSIDIEGELTKTAFNSFFIQEKPHAIEYTSGNDRYRIVDLDDKPGYEARKTIADTK